MAREEVLCLLLIIALTGCHADYTRSGFWDYFSQLATEKNEWNPHKDSATEVSVFRNSFQNGVNYVGNIFSPLKSGLQKHLYEDSDGLRKLIRRELQDIRRKIYPFIDEAHEKITKNLEQVQNRLVPYTNELKYHVTWGAKEFIAQFSLSKDPASNGAPRKLAENVQDQINLQTEKVRKVLLPLGERLLAEIHHAIEELHGNLSPHALTSQEKLTAQVQELSRKLTQNANNLHEKIHKNLDALKEQLGTYPRNMRERLPDSQPGEPVAPYVEEMAAQVQREVEEFQRNTHLQIEHFTNTINMEMEEMKFKLSPATSELHDTVTSVEEIQGKLESLWTEISQNLK
ncbi:apolipoprotein A-V isoform X2 [Hyla sarda]|uniref:apolipoprotein A-V isoform X2 n=1 Tax=Hyla sarda TaxID=327740 RepID=UPI0024C2D635|nr:apolipoprotein A-V isoform X2 [Hyla sarda]